MPETPSLANGSPSPLPPIGGFIDLASEAIVRRSSTCASTSLEDLRRDLFRCFPCLALIAMDDEDAYDEDEDEIGSEGDEDEPLTPTTPSEA